MTNMSSLAEPSQMLRPALSRRSGAVGLNRGYLACRNAGTPESPQSLQAGSPSTSIGSSPSPIERVSLSSLSPSQKGTSNSRNTQRSSKNNGLVNGNTQVSLLAPPPPVEFDLDYGPRSFSSSRVVNPAFVDELSALSHKSYRMASGSRVGRRHGARTARNGTGDFNYLNEGAGLDNQRAASMSRTRQQCFKTKMCHFFVQQKCSRGTNCVFAHSGSELRLTPDLSKTKICVKWKKGLCTDSTQCNYAHGVDDLQPAVQQWLNPISQMAFGDQDGNVPMDVATGMPLCQTTTTSTCASMSDVVHVPDSPQPPDSEWVTENSTCDVARENSVDNGVAEPTFQPEHHALTNVSTVDRAPHCAGDFTPSGETKATSRNAEELDCVESVSSSRWASPEVLEGLPGELSNDDTMSSHLVDSPPPTERQPASVDGQTAPGQPSLHSGHSCFSGHPVPMSPWGYSDGQKQTCPFPAPPAGPLFPPQQPVAACAPLPLRSIAPYGGGQLGLYPSYSGQSHTGAQTGMESGPVLLPACPPIAQPLPSPLQKQTTWMSQTVSSPVAATLGSPASHRLACGAVAQPAQQHYIYHNGYLVPVVFATSIPRRPRDCSGAMAMYPIIPCSPHTLPVPHHVGGET